MEKPRTVCNFYNCMSEEPESTAYGRKVMRILDEAKIAYELRSPHNDPDEHYETIIVVADKDYKNARKNIRF